MTRHVANFLSFFSFFFQLFKVLSRHGYKASAIGVDPEPFVVVLLEIVIAIGVVVHVIIIVLSSTEI